ncbi:MAG: TonB-dependent receptor [Burkholderiales bacterium]|nr:TonB-dependent receptor [Burkholderiales bacterium]
MTRSIANAALAAALLSPAVAAAQGTGLRITDSAVSILPPVVVTATPLGAELFGLASPAAVLQGQGLRRKTQSTLGETLGNEVGVASTYFGPNASRPIIRGLDGDRIQLLQNGVGVLDASAASFDHAVSLEPLLVDRIEVVRGPAALMYGGNAVGGVVNVVDGRIPREPLGRPFAGAIDLRYGSQNDERAGGVRLDAEGKGVVLHADAFGRRTDDLRIPGFQRSAQLRARDPAAARRSRAGRPAAQQRRAGVRRRARRFAPVRARPPRRRLLGLRHRLRHRRGGHGAHRPAPAALGGGGRAARSVPVDQGAAPQGRPLGLPAQRARGRGVGHRVQESRLRRAPRSRAREARPARGCDRLPAHAVRLLRARRRGVRAGHGDRPLGGLRLRAGGARSLDALVRWAARAQPGAGERARRHRRRAGAGPGREPDPRRRAHFHAGERLGRGRLRALARVGGSAQRGLHRARTDLPGALLERPARRDERVRDRRSRPRQGTLDRVRSRPAAAGRRLARRSRVFYNRFSGFVALLASVDPATGQPLFRDADDRTSPAVADPAGAGYAAPIQQYQYGAVPATFYGLELEGSARVWQGSGQRVDVELRGDYTRAKNRATGAPLPRIAPLRYGGAAIYARGVFSARLDVLRAEAQRRVPAGELSTDGYTLLDASIAYRLRARGVAGEVFLRIVNLLDDEIRYATSFVRDIAPAGGRGVAIGLRTSF